MLFSLSSSCLSLPPAGSPGDSVQGSAITHFPQPAVKKLSLQIYAEKFFYFNIFGDSGSRPSKIVQRTWELAFLKSDCSFQVYIAIIIIVQSSNDQ